eukprot:768235-Hanusia_phi.AAC.6
MSVAGQREGDGKTGGRAIPKELGKEREALLLWCLQAVLKVEAAGPCPRDRLQQSQPHLPAGGATLVRYGTMGRNQQLKVGTASARCVLKSGLGRSDCEVSHGAGEAAVPG